MHAWKMLACGACTKLSAGVIAPDVGRDHSNLGMIISSKIALVNAFWLPWYTFGD